MNDVTYSSFYQVDDEIPVFIHPFPKKTRNSSNLLLPSIKRLEALSKDPSGGCKKAGIISVNACGPSWC